MKNLGSFLHEIVERNRQKPALLYRPGNTTEVWTYSQLWEKSGAVARWLQDMGVGKGDRVIIWAPNSPWWVASYFGALRIGIILVPLDVRSSEDFVARIVEQTEPKLALLSGSTRSGWKGPAQSYLMEDFAALPLDGREPAAEEVTPEDIAEVMFTSGTTGAPKGVILTHANILNNVEASDQYVPETPHYRTVSILPLSHMFEQGAGLLLSMKRDASIYYLSNLQPSTLFGALSEHGATALLLVPQALQLFMSSIEREVAKQGKEKAFHRMMKMADHLPMGARRMFFRQIHQKFGGMLEFLVSGGAPIEPELVHKWELLGIPIIQGYGATEASPVIAASQMHNRNPRTVGTPVPGMQIKFADDGEVLIKGPSVTQGYWRNPQATEEAFEDGWYKTGDLGYFDEGLLYLHGRKKDMIALANGQKVYPQDVEQALMGLTGVVDATVVGLPSETNAADLEVHAVLILDENSPGVEQIIKQANARLAPHQHVRDYTIWPEKELPRTYTLKVKKHEVLAKLLEMRRPPEPAVTPAEVPAESTPVSI